MVEIQEPVIGNLKLRPGAIERTFGYREYSGALVLRRSQDIGTHTEVDVVGESDVCIDPNGIGRPRFAGAVVCEAIRKLEARV